MSRNGAFCPNAVLEEINVMVNYVLAPITDDKEDMESEGDRLLVATTRVEEWLFEEARSRETEEREKSPAERIEILQKLAAKFRQWGDECEADARQIRAEMN